MSLKRLHCAKCSAVLKILGYCMHLILNCFGEYSVRPTFEKLRRRVADHGDRSKAWTGFARWNAGIVGSNTTWARPECLRLLFYRPVFFCEVRLSPLGTSATGNRSTRRKPAPVPLCPPQIPHDLTWARTRAAADRSRRLTDWAVTRSVLCR
jgi:hypothetical protein